MRVKSNIKNIEDPKPFKSWFESIYDKYFEKLYRYAFSITKSKDLAEDVVEEVFLNIWKRQNGHLTIKEPDSYLHVSVKHVAIRTISQEPSSFSYAKYEESLNIVDAVDPENLLLHDELQKVIAEVVKDLPPHCWLVYDMLKNKGMSYEEASRELQISKKTVESHICKALSRIKGRLSKYFDHHDNQYQLIAKIGIVLLFIFI